MPYAISSDMTYFIAGYHVVVMTQSQVLGRLGSHTSHPLFINVALSALNQVTRAFPADMVRNVIAAGHIVGGTERATQGT